MAKILNLSCASENFISSVQSKQKAKIYAEVDKFAIAISSPRFLMHVIKTSSGFQYCFNMCYKYELIYKIKNANKMKGIGIIVFILF
jgi:hypothetical protein